MKKLKQNLRGICTFSNGITLINLVITIVILIILASIIINIGLGKNGIFTKSKEAKQEYSEVQEKEILETVLLEAQMRNQTEENFDKETTLNEMLMQANMRNRG